MSAPLHTAASIGQPATERQNTARRLESKQSVTLRIPEAIVDPNPQEVKAHPMQVFDHEHEVPIKACLLPKELYDHIVEAGVVKANMRFDKQFTLALIAAFYIGFSGTAMMVVGGQIPTVQLEEPGLYNLVLGCFGFPLGLFMICVVGADLFTSNCAYMMVALHEGRISYWRLVRNWTLSWFVNLVGCIWMAAIVYWAWIFHGREEYPLWLAHKKTSYPFSVIMCKGILANWLVNLAVWIANAAQDVSGKAIGIFIPISAFIAMGGEHCIANQFFFSLAKLLGSEIPVNTMIVKNLIPATIGNIIGGSFFVGTMYSCALGTLLASTYRVIGQVFWWARAKATGVTRDEFDARQRAAGVDPESGCVAGIVPAAWIAAVEHKTGAFTGKTTRATAGSETGSVIPVGGHGLGNGNLSTKSAQILLPPGLSRAVMMLPDPTHTARDASAHLPHVHLEMSSDGSAGLNTSVDPPSSDTSDPAPPRTSRPPALGSAADLEASSQIQRTSAGQPLVRGKAR